MKKNLVIIFSFVFILLASIFIPSHSVYAATPTLVSHTGKVNSTTTTAIDTTGANFLVVACHYFYTDTMTVSDNKGNSWYPLNSYGVGSVTGFVQIFYAYNATVGTNHTFSCHNQSFIGITASAYSGVLSTSDPFDKINGGSITGSSTIQTGNITPSQSGGLIISAWSSGDSAESSVSVNSNLNNLDTIHDSNNMDGGMAYLVNSNTNTINPTWTIGSDSNLSATIASFKSAGTATSFTLSGPSSGTVNTTSTNFTVTPNGTFTGTITITPSGAGLSAPIVLTFSDSATPQTFTITPTTAGTVTLTPTNNGSFTNPSNLSYAVNLGASCSATVTGVWSTGSNWTGCTGAGGIPSATDNITINSGVTMTLDGDVTVASITVAGTLNTTASNYVVNTGTITINTGGIFDAFWSDVFLTGNTGTIITNNGSFNSDGTLKFSGNGDITLINGAIGNTSIASVNIVPTITANHTYTLGSGFANIGGNFNIHPTGAFNLTVVPNNGLSVYHEMLVGGYGGATISMDTGSSTNYALTVGGSLVFDAGSTLTANASIITLGASFPIDQQLRFGGTFNYGSSTVILNSDSNQTNLLGDGAINFYNLTISPTLTADRTYTFSRAFNVLNNFTVNGASASSTKLTVNLGGTTSVTGALTVQGTGNATSLLEAFQGTTNYTVTRGSLSVLAGGTYLPTYIATTFTLTGPTSGDVNATSTNFTITPSSFYTGTVTITPAGGGLSSPIVKTFSNSYTPQTFTITPTSVGTVTLTPTNNGGITNPGNSSYVVSLGGSHTYYIDPLGNDSNDGLTTSTPWQTLTKVNATSFVAGDQVLFKKDGVWAGEIIAKTSGASGNPITYSSYGSGTNKPTISGFSSLSGWTSLGGGIYEATCSNCGATLNMVTLNGAQQAIGRYPNANAANGGYLTYQSYTGTSITDSSLSGGPNWTGAQIVMRSAYWTLDVNPITSFSGTTINFTSATGGTPQTGFGYFIQNSPAALDQLGEWSYSSTTKKVQMYFGGNNPTSYIVNAATVPSLLNIDTKNYITVDGLSFQGSSAVTMEIYGDNNITIQNSDFNFAGVTAMDIEVSNNFIIQNSTITNSNNTAVVVGNWGMSNNILVKNNIITNSGSIPGLGKSGTGGYIAINAYGSNTKSNVTFEKNTITNTGYNAIIFDGEGAIVKNNIIDNFCTILNDGAGIYTYNGNGDTHTVQRQVVGNIVINGSTNSTYGTGNPTYKASSGIYMDDNTDNVIISGNTVANIPYAGIFLHNDKDITVTANTVYNAYEAVYIQTNNNLSHLIRGMNISDNNFISATTTQLAISAGSSTNGDTIAQYGALDNNYYSRPLGLGKIFYGGTTNLTLAQWRSTYGEDVNSSEVITQAGASFNFLYNTTANSSVRSFVGSTYTDVRGVSYTDSITLAPYSSAVLTQTLTSATSYTITGPSSGTVNATSTNFTITPNAAYTGTITITPSGAGLSTPIIKTFSGTSTAQTFTITPTSAGTVTLTPTNNGGITNPSNLSYTVNSSSSCFATATGVWSNGSNWTGCTGAGGIPGATDNITINSGVTMTLDGDVTVASISVSGTLNTTATNYVVNTGTITINTGGIFDAFWSDVFLTGNTGTIITNNGSFNSDGTLKFSGNGDITLINGAIGNTSIASVNIVPTITANHTYTLGSGFANIGGNFNIHPTGAFNLTVVPNNGLSVYHEMLVGGYGGATISMDTGSSTNYALTVGGSLVFDAGSTLTANASIITLGASFPIDQQLRFGGTFNYGSSTVILNSDSNQTNLLGDGAINFYNLTISPTLTADRTYTFSRAFNVLNNFTVNGASASSTKLTVNLGGTTSVTGALTVQGTGNATSLLEAFQGTTNYTVTRGSLSVLAGGTYLPTYIATTFTLTGPTSGDVNATSTNFTITPSSFYTGTVTITPAGGGLSSPIVKTFSNSYTPQTFTITPTSVGTVTLTPTNNGGITNPGVLSYMANSGVTIPTASSVAFTGTATVNQTLTGTYTYADSGSHPETTSTFRWLRASTPTGTYSAISGATSSTYTLVSADIGNYIKFEVTPVSNVATGSAVLSSASAQINSSSVPTASAVSISGTTTDGQTLAGSYTYNQANSVAEGTSTFRWLRASTAGGTYSAISGATSATYTLVSADIGNYIKFEVIPVAVFSPTTGIAVLSSASSQVTVSAVPTASSVAFTGTATVNQTLTGTYTYADSGSHPETVSTFRWLRASTSNGTYSAISGATSSTYTLVSADIGNYIKFEVTPVSNVATGSAVLSGASAQIANIAVVSGGGGGGGSSGGGSGGGGFGAVIPTTIKETTTVPTLVKSPDITTTAPSVSIATLSITKNLKQGLSDGEVIKLQTILQQLGFFPKEAALSNNFGPITKQAVIKYQKSLGLEPVGEVGPLTRKMLNGTDVATTTTTVPTVIKSSDVPETITSNPITQILQLGSNNSEVMQLQIILRQLGFFPKETELSNNFGPITKQAVIKYQKSLGLDPIGAVGPMTRKMLNAATASVTKTPVTITTTPIKHLSQP